MNLSFLTHSVLQTDFPPPPCHRAADISRPRPTCPQSIRAACEVIPHPRPRPHTDPTRTIIEDSTAYWSFHNVLPFVIWLRYIFAREARVSRVALLRFRHAEPVA